MISSIRKEILRLLGEISGAAPEIRFGQLVANMAFLASGPWNETLWDLEDEQLLSALQNHLADLESRHQDVA